MIHLEIADIVKRLDWAVDRLKQAEGSLVDTDLPMRVGTPILGAIRVVRHDLMRMADHAPSRFMGTQARQDTRAVLDVHFAGLQKVEEALGQTDLPMKVGASIQEDIRAVRVSLSDLVG